MAAMYAVYHGPKGVQRIADRVHRYTVALATSIREAGYTTTSDAFFDTLTVDVSNVKGGSETLHRLSKGKGINFRTIGDKTIGVTLDESVNTDDLVEIVNVFREAANASLVSEMDLKLHQPSAIPDNLTRTSPFMTQPIFNKHHSETELMRYIHHLQSKDLSLVHAMIPLGSCTMKLNSASSMFPLSWPEYSHIHPFAPRDQVQGYRQIIEVR
jgi:glycine dehydrogenase